MPNVNSGPIFPPSSVGLLREPYPAVNLPVPSPSVPLSGEPVRYEIQTLSQTRGLPSGPRISLSIGAVFGSSPM